MNAWLGWVNFIQDGKYVALAMAVLLFYWFGEKRQETDGDAEGAEAQHGSARKVLYVYGTILVIACICPLTAAVLMKYQTRFYDYQWIWSLAPVTLLIAVGATGLYLQYVDKLKRNAKMVLIACGVALLILAGRKGAPIEDSVDKEQLATAKAVLEQITAQDDGAESTICLWAPKEIMTYARALQGEVLLPYGRDMWDAHLGAYSYDTYSAEAEDLYRYMSAVEEWGTYNPIGTDAEGTQSVLNGDKYITQAADMGVTHILLPKNIASETVAQAEAVLGVESQTVEGYYLLVIE